MFQSTTDNDLTYIIKQKYSKSSHLRSLSHAVISCLRNDLNDCYSIIVEEKEYQKIFTFERPETMLSN